MNLSYSEIVDFLERLYRISPTGQGAFRARLRKLQGEGVPIGSNPGKGKRVEYTTPMIIDAVIACELMQCGLSPQEAAEMIKANRHDFYHAGLLAILTVKDPQRDPIALVNPESLRQYTTEGVAVGSGELGAVTFVSRARLLELFSKRKPFEPVTGEPWRWSMIDLGLLIFTFMSVLESPKQTADEVLNSLLDDVQENMPAVLNFERDRLNSITDFFDGEEDDG